MPDKEHLVLLVERFDGLQGCWNIMIGHIVQCGRCGGVLAFPVPSPFEYPWREAILGQFLRQTYAGSVVRERAMREDHGRSVVIRYLPKRQLNAVLRLDRNQLHQASQPLTRATEARWVTVMA